MENESTLTNFFNSIWPHFGERERHLAAAAGAMALGYGAVSLINRITGLSRRSILNGLHKLEANEKLESGRQHNPGASRPLVESIDPTLQARLWSLIEANSLGEPENQLLWPMKNSRILSLELQKLGHQVSQVTVGKLFRRNSYNLQNNFKAAASSNIEDRNSQFQHISTLVTQTLSLHFPIIAINTNIKKLLGNSDNIDQQRKSSKNPRKVNGPDLPSSEFARAYPYGIYDMTVNTGVFHIATDHQASEFAVNSIKGWWRLQGKNLYSTPDYILITVNGGNSNGFRNRLWILKLQELADYLGFTVKVCHFPPGISKWNKIEHRLFSFISSNWRGQPLTDYETMVSLISDTNTAQELSVSCRLDHRKYASGRKVTDKEMSKVNITPAVFQSEWNYEIQPQV
jgi:hypothetical protein